jgi:hypothetical protein
MIMKTNEKGQALILIALAAIGLFSFSALAIDGGRVFSDRRHAQNAADTAVLAAALAKIKGQDYSAAALARAASNGYANDGDRLVEVNLCSESGISCQGLPPGANRSEYIRVKITSTLPTTLARVIGRQSVTNVVEAIARAQGSTSVSPFFLGAGIATLKPTGEKAFEINGNATLDVVDSGTFVNSNANCGMHANGNITMSVDTSFAVVGTLCQNGNITRNGPVTQATAIPYPPELDIPQPSITCTGNGSKSGNTYYPGTWNDEMKIEGNGSATLMPGNYCLKKGAVINGNLNVTANNVNIRLIAEEFIINGNTTFTCTNTIFFSDGGKGFRFNGNGVNNCTEAFFYVRTGEVRWNGNVSNTFQAPTSGPYKGLLIYMPYENTTPLDINGNSGNHIKGTILAVHSHINLNGNMGMEVLDSQVIGYTVKFNGNGTLRIDYDANENYAPPSLPTIELTK